MDLLFFFSPASDCSSFTFPLKIKQESENIMKHSEKNKIP